VAWAGVPYTGHSEPPAIEIECAELALQRTTLDEFEAGRLCLGAPSDAPAACFEQALDVVAIDEPDAIDLCRCASSTEPVRCYAGVIDVRPADTREALRVCSPITARKLTADCRPIVPADPGRSPS
jgi:hypothetical protein